MQVARASFNDKRHELKPGDAAAVSQETRLAISGKADDSEVLLFDLA